MRKEKQGVNKITQTQLEEKFKQRRTRKQRNQINGIPNLPEAKGAMTKSDGSLLSEKGSPGKPPSYWDSKVHVVVKGRGNNSPAFEVVPEGGSKSCASRWNHLLPRNSLPLDEPERDPKPEKNRKSKTKENEAI